MIPVQVVGLGMSPADLTSKARQIIEAAQVLVGGKRLLKYFPNHPARKIPLGKDPQKTLKELPSLAASQRVVVLASGDPNFYGVGPLVVEALGAERVVLYPNVTAVQAACARLKIAWQDAAVVSLHGRAWEPLKEALKEGGKLIIYTDPQHPPEAIARFLLARGHGQMRLCVCEDLGQDTERVSWLSAAEAQTREFSPLNLVVAWPDSTGEEGIVSEDEAPASGAQVFPALHLGLPEEALAHQQGLITKVEVRAVVLAKLQLGPGQVLWDVGAGCGSVGLEASLLLGGGRIFAVEQDPQRAAQIKANREKYRVANLEVVLGQAPKCLAGLPTPERVFVGGGGRILAKVLKEVIKRLDSKGRVVLTATLLKSLETARQVLGRAGWQVEVVQLQVSRARPLGDSEYLQALNPVWVVTAMPPGGKP